MRRQQEAAVLDHWQKHGFDPRNHPLSPKEQAMAFKRALAEGNIPTATAIDYKCEGAHRGGSGGGTQWTRSQSATQAAARNAQRARDHYSIFPNSPEIRADHPLEHQETRRAASVQYAEQYSNASDKMVNYLHAQDLESRRELLREGAAPASHSNPTALPRSWSAMHRSEPVGARDQVLNNAWSYDLPR
jgi:uncharacterized protein YbdZ (MbtH family)